MMAVQFWSLKKKILSNLHHNIYRFSIFWANFWHYLWNFLNLEVFWENFRHFSPIHTIIFREFRVLSKFTIFFREWTFCWQNKGMRAVIFSRQIEKKRASYWPFSPIIWCYFDRMDVFGPSMGIIAGEFSWKIWKNYIIAQCFLR